ncbi:Sugar phosphatase YfbT [termite gut metagenome]|uniref:Sugar phosphatase YfbT n=1 Tax=termite gut metagenome TaxID=433724 RepID=A0A5J4SQ17_9ZZZZ
MYRQAIKDYLHTHEHQRINLKSVLFDMDGVLFDSMPNHANAWHKAMKAHDLDLSFEEAYLHEGRTGADTINIICKRQLNREASPEEIETMYHDKTVEFNTYPLAERMPGTKNLLRKIKDTGVISTVVTGSGQSSLLERLEGSYPGLFHLELMVTAFDVTYGKPHPEPYLMALTKGSWEANEAIVVENAPLGVEAGVRAGIFTIAVNTGPLADKVLTSAGANLLFPSMQALSGAWEELYAEFNREL